MHAVLTILAAFALAGRLYLMLGRRFYWRAGERLPTERILA